jgi:hypothetical protein
MFKGKKKANSPTNKKKCLEKQKQKKHETNAHK